MSVKERLNAGLQNVYRGNYQQAEAIIRQVLQNVPDNADAFYVLGLIRLNTGKTEEGIKCIGKAILLNPAVWIYHYDLGTILFKLGRLDDAIRFYQKATALHEEFTQHRIDEVLLTYLHASHNDDVPSGGQLTFSCFSYPKCGTHFLSDILQKVTGRSFFWPEATVFSPEILTNIPENSFLTGHFAAHPEYFDFFHEGGHRLIINFRDPRDQIVSFYFYYTEIDRKGDNEWGRLLRTFDKERAINILISTCLAGGIAHPLRMAGWINGWLEFARRGIPVLFVPYEELVRDRTGSIGRIARFLGCDTSGARIREIADETSFHRRSSTIEGKGKKDGELKRKGRAGDWRNHFTEGNVEVFNSVAGALIRQLGYDVV